MSAVPILANEVVFVLLPDVVLLDVAGPAAAFRNAARRIPGSYRLRFVAPQQAVAAAVGLTLSGLEPLPERLAPGTILVLTGISGAVIDPQAPATRCVIDWLRDGGRPARLMCVCAGSVLAAYAGLLAARLCSAHPPCSRQAARDAQPTRPRARRDPGRFSFGTASAPRLVAVGSAAAERLSAPRARVPERER